MEYVTVSFQLCHYILIKKPWMKSNTLIWQAYLALRKRDAILDQQNLVIFKPTNLHLKTLIMSIFKNTSWLEDIWKTSKDDPLVASIKKCLNNNTFFLILIKKLNSIMAFSIKREFCIYLHDLCNLTLEIPCVFLPISLVFDIVGKVNFSKNKSTKP